jgi:hypothetical protein
MSDDRLTRHMTVLDLVAPPRTKQAIRVAFVSPLDSGASHQVYLDRATWEDMGQPDQVTIAVYPGDTLNEQG